MQKNINAIKDTINSPEAVYNSSSFEDRKVFFKKSTYSTYDYNKLYTKVIVGYNENVGEVVTTFQIEEIKGRIGDVIYKKSNIILHHTI